MTILKCKMCGGDVQAGEGALFGTCESCGGKSTLPRGNDGKTVNLFNRANHFRRLNEFDKALAAYENILNEDDANAEAHWCAVLCRYGIEYVEDARTGERVPTCHRTQFEPILSDPDYLAALQYAPDEYTRSLYEEEAGKIGEIQKGILAISGKEEPFDVFICYKESTDGGGRTKDSVIAQDIYHQLANGGRRVFFAKITLEDKLGRQYEPYIFNALNSAKVMLVVGTRKEHFEAVWVKNEWSRYLALMRKDRSRLLIPCYLDMDAYDLPDELSSLQSQDMSKVGFIQDVLRGVGKVLDAGKPEGKADTGGAEASTAAPGLESLMTRGKLFLEDGNWREAASYFNRVLDINPKHAPAYLGVLCAKFSMRGEEDLGQYEPSAASHGDMDAMLEFIHKNPLLSDSEYQKAFRFGDDALRARLKRYEGEFIGRVSEKAYDALVRQHESASSDREYLALMTRFLRLGGYKDAEALASQCKNAARKAQYDTALQMMKDAIQREDSVRLHDLAVSFSSMEGFENADELEIECENRCRTIEKREREQKREERERREAEEKETAKLLTSRKKIRRLLLLAATISFLCYSIVLSIVFPDIPISAISTASLFWMLGTLSMFCSKEYGLGTIMFLVFSAAPAFVALVHMHVSMGWLALIAYLSFLVSSILLVFVFPRNDDKHMARVIGNHLNWLLKKL